MKTEDIIIGTAVAGSLLYVTTRPKEIITPTQIIHNTDQQFNQGTYINTQLDNQGRISLNRKNLLENSSFDYDMMPYDRGANDGLASHWGIYKPVPTDPHTQAIEIIDGRKAQRITFTSISGKSLSLMQSAKILYDKDHTLSSYVKIDNPAQFDVNVTIQFYGENNTIYRSSVSSSLTSPISFTRIYMTGKSPSNADTIRAIITLKPKSGIIFLVTGTIWADDAQLELGTFPTDYVAKYDISQGEYISPPIYLGDNTDINTNPHKLEITASLPDFNKEFATSISLQTRSGNTIEELNRSLWYGIPSSPIPTGLGNFYPYIYLGPELLQNTDLMLDSNNDGIPDYTRQQSWGIHTGTFSVLTDPITNEKSLKADITSYITGNRRWEFLYDGSNGPIEYPHKEYLYSVLHRETNLGSLTYIRPAVHAVKLDNTTIWWYASKYPYPLPSPYPNWKEERLIFRTRAIPYDINKFWLAIHFYNIGGVQTKNYSLRKVYRQKEWQINSTHQNHKYIQYRVIFMTTDTSWSPLLYDVRINYNTSIPEIRNTVLSDIKGQVRYVFRPGDLCNIKTEVIDYKGYNNISEVKIDVYQQLKLSYDNNDNRILSGNMLQNILDISTDNIDNINISRYYQYSFTIPTYIPLDSELKIIMTIKNQPVGTTFNKKRGKHEEYTFIKIRE